MEWTKDIGGSCRIRAVRLTISPWACGYFPGEAASSGAHETALLEPYLAVTIETIIHATDGVKRQWVAIASAVSVEGDVAEGLDANGLARDPVILRMDRVRAMLCESGGMPLTAVRVTALHDLLRTAWADVRRVA